MSIDLAALKAEIQTDPNGYGYSVTNNVLTGNLLNELRSAIRMDRELIPAHEVIDALVPAEWASATDQEKARISLIVSAGEVNVQSSNTQAAFLAAFGVGTATRTNLVGLLTRDGSRSEQLFGAGVSVSYAKVSEALRG